MSRSGSNRGPSALPAKRLTAGPHRLTHKQFPRLAFLVALLYVLTTSTRFFKRFCQKTCFGRFYIKTDEVKTDYKARKETSRCQQTSNASSALPANALSLCVSVSLSLSLSLPPSPPLPSVFLISRLGGDHRFRGTIGVRCAYQITDSNFCVKRLERCRNEESFQCNLQ